MKDLKKNLVHWQPTLKGDLLSISPLKLEDFETLYAAAADPKIWEQHPAKNRYMRDIFQQFFHQAIESQGALAVIDHQTNCMIGSSRFTNYNEQNSSVEIGYTFLRRKYWGGAYNRELKALMLSYAFKFVSAVNFQVGENNLRSRRALEKIGASEIDKSIKTSATGERLTTIIYQIQKAKRELAQQSAPSTTTALMG